ncbi:protein modifying enzyme [Lithospermum erythrorhizon]|uniref:S-acyltransferase n=1 Tax=Lithospermum erythrorhizon TaxID=34254 RepID=A0AAV3PRA3_LITER
MIIIRRHGWQRPLHPLQIVGMAVFCFLVVCFYCFLGLFLGNRVARIIVLTAFSFVVLSAAFLFVRCAAIDPTDKTRFRKKKRKANPNSRALPHLRSYMFILGQIVLRFFRRVERKILRTCIRRKYLLDPWKSSLQLEPLLPFPLVLKDDVSVAFNPKEEDMSFCSLCNFEVKNRSKHCRTCNRCVEGFDHHCRWLNNCVGKKNYTTFILMMICVLIMLLIEGGTAIAIFVRCFTDKKGIEQDLERRLYVECPRWALATITVLLVLMTAYSAAALGQLFLFHIVLIRKGMRTYDYILAMREENRSLELEESDDSDFSSDENTDYESPDEHPFATQDTHRERLEQKSKRLSIRIDGTPDLSKMNKKQGLHASIDPWKLITMSREKALLAASRARDRLMTQKTPGGHNSLKPLPLETKCGPLVKQDKDVASIETGMTPLISKIIHPGSPGHLSSPRRRFSYSPSVSPNTLTLSKQTYRSNFDLKLTQVSRELESYISRQVMCSVLRKDENEESPR